MVTVRDEDGGERECGPVTAADLVELCATYAPRRFAACEVSPDGTASRVVGLGVHTDEGGVMMAPGESSMWSLDSPEAVVGLLGRRRDVRLVWLDPASESPATQLPAAR